ncbi:uncharacterized protein DUF4214 [Pseudoduganella lurida]|uniref:Uncharacterized protein DUF4214 n=1 Tax=Pseudoduganella lurida TaxID=1036180 RepID=A0A562R7X7_9BURK|nr:DUF4214 domain-containing protein [Pseudoduganella lurida]TWI65167.1 uncharacterized protein DUF4214 [Pseudoduganella lurida]
MSALGSLVVKLALEYAEYTRGLDRSDQASLAFAQRAQRHFDTASRAGSDFFDGVARRALQTAATMVTVGAAIEAVSRSIDNLATLDDLNQKTGASVESLSKLQQVAGQFDHDFGSVDSALTKLAKGMAGVDEDSSKTNKALKALGLSAKDSAGNLRDPSEVMVDVAKKLQGYEDGAAKAALMNDLFGKSGVELLPFLNDAADSFDQMAGRTKESAQQAALFQDQMNRMKSGVRELATDITVAALPAMNDLLGAIIDVGKENDTLKSGDVASWADDLGLGMARVVDVAKIIPRLLSAVGGSFKSVWADIKLANTMMDYASPAGWGKALASGKSPVAEIKNALAARNQVVEEANQQLVDLWNKPANETEQAYLKRLEARNSKKAAADPSPDRRKLDYRAGGTDPAAAAAVSAAKSAYDTLNKTVRERLAIAEQEVASGRALSESEKEIAKLQRDRADGTVEMTDAQAAEIIGNLQQLDTLTRASAAGKEVQKLYDDIAKASRDKVAAAVEDADANERLASTFGKSKAEIEALELSRLQEQLAQRSSIGMTLEEIEELEKLVAAKQRSAAAVGQVAEMESAKKGLDELNAYLDPAKAQTFGESLKEAFGTAGDAVSKLTATMDGFGKRQAEIAKQRGNAAEALLTGLIDEKEYTEKLAKLNQAETKSRLAGYGDMAGAAAGFFGEQSKGYQALMAVSKVFHAAELAMTLAELVPKGIAAVLNQGTGDPYSAFARMAAMAAIVAGLGVAIGGSSGSGGQSAADVQKTQGTGSVFGDSEAKSESIANSLEMLEKNSDSLIPINKGMLDALRAIEASMTGLTNLVVRVPGLTEGENLDIATGVLGKSLGGLWGKTKQTIVDSGLQFGGSVRDLQQGHGYNQYATVDTTKSSWFGLKKKTTTSTETAALSDELSSQFGLIFSNVELALEAAADSLGIGAGHVNAVLDGLKIDTTKLSLKGLSGDELTDALNAVISKAMDDMSQAVFPDLDAFRKVGEGYTETVVRLASDYSRLDAALASTGGSFGAVGLSSLQARERLIALAGGIDQFESQTASFAENYLTEQQRLAPVQKYVTEQLAAMGLASVTTRDQFRDVTLGIDKTTEAGAKQYTALMALEAAFAAVTPATNEAKDATELLADRKKLEGQIYDMTHTAEEALTRQRAEELAAMDASLQPLQERIYALQDEEAAQAKVAALAASRGQLESQIFDLTHTAAESLARQRGIELAAMDASLRPLQERIYSLQDEKTAAEAASKATAEAAQAAADAISKATEALKSNVTDALTAVQRAVQGQKDTITKAFQESMDALEKRIDGVNASISNMTSLSSALHSALDGMPIAGQEQSSRAAAQAQIAAALAIAKAGGPLPQADALEKALTTVRADASAQFSSYLDYQRDQYRTVNDIAALGELTDSQLSTEEQMLKALEDQKEHAQAAYDAEVDRLDGILEAAQKEVDVLNGIHTGVLSIPEALAALSRVIAEAMANPTLSVPSKVAGAYQQYLGRDASAGEISYWQGQAGAGVNVVDAINKSNEAKIQDLYRTLLGRDGEAAGVDWWEKALASGQSLDDIKAGFMGSDEYKKLHPFAVGTNYVPSDMPALIHEGERIIPAGDNRELMARLRAPGVDNSALLDELRLLRIEVSELRTAASKTADNTNATSKLLVRVSRNGDRLVTQDIKELA